MNDDWNAITSAVRLLRQAQIWIDDTPGLTPDMLRSNVLQLQKEKDGISLVVLDNLKQIRVPCLRSNRATEVAEIARSLKEITKEAKVSVVAHLSSSAPSGTQLQQWIPCSNRSS